MPSAHTTLSLVTLMSTETNVKMCVKKLFELQLTLIHFVYRRLTVGSAAGAIRDLFAKVKAIDAKHGKFALVLCTGDFFEPPKEEGQEYGDDEDVMQLLNGSLEGASTSTVSSNLHD